MIELDSVVHLINKLLSNNDLKNFILFHANKASIRTTLKTPTSDPTGSSSRASSADLTSTNLESTPVSLRQDNASIANTSFNSFTMPNHHHLHAKTAEKLIKNDYISLSYDFKQIDWSQEEVVPLDKFDVIEQESLLINDLLYVLVVSASRSVEKSSSELFSFDWRPPTNRNSFAI